MTELIDTKIKQLEDFIFSENKVDFLDKLLPETEEYQFFKLNYELKKGKGVLPPDLQKTYKNLMADYKSKDEIGKSIKLKYLLYKLDTEIPDADAKKKLLKQINKMTANYGFKHLKPKIAEGMKANTADEICQNSTLDQAKISIKTKLATALEKPSELNEIDPTYLIDHDFEGILAKCLETDPDQFAKIIKRTQILSIYPKMPELLMTYFKKEYLAKKKDPAPAIEAFESSLNKLSLTQIEYIHELNIPDVMKSELFFTIHFRKHFAPQIALMKNQTDLEPEDDALIESMGQFVTTKYSENDFRGMPRQITLTRLYLKWKNGVLDEQLFNQYVRDPLTELPIYKSKWLNKYWKADHQQYEGILPGRKIILTKHDYKLLTDMLLHLFKDKKDYSYYERYLNVDYLKKIFYEAKLKKGDKVGNISKIMSSEEINMLNNEKIVEFDRSNKRVFLEGEEVKLKIVLKNIKSLTVKAFKINLVEYIKNEHRSFDFENCDLDGLVASEEMEQTLDHASIKVVERSYTFDEITKCTRGMYIIDVIGDGISSRAVIKKGNLFLVKETRGDGIYCRLLNEKKEICKGSKVGIWWKQKWYGCSPDSGEIKVPFGANNFAEHVTLCDGDFGVYKQVNWDTEHYIMSTCLIFDEETLIPGHKSRIIVNNMLKLGHNAISMSRLEKYSIT
jgi:hypothetical protein